MTRTQPLLPSEAAVYHGQYMVPLARFTPTVGRYVDHYNRQGEKVEGKITAVDMKAMTVHIDGVKWDLVDDTRYS